jgi:mannose-6-phosphate isomerase-like protein (cupin superfamily)
VDASARYAIAHLDDLERLPAFGLDGIWRPVRHHFGIEAFGINAYTADVAGQLVIEPHDELPTEVSGAAGHQELYLVLSGSAVFTIDGDSVQAPAGTFVFLGDPAANRGAVASEPSTTVLAIGGVPGEPYQVSAWEYAFRGLALRGADGSAAFAEGLVRYPDKPSLYYNLACMHALDGERDAALEALERAVALEPKSREWAARDEDFASLRGDDRFNALVG